MITVYTIAFNEGSFIQFMIDHYRQRFPDCKIVLYDNYSTDNTVEIAKANNCEVQYFDTNNQINDIKYLEVKNNCWKNADTDWVLVCDMDELLDITQQQLMEEDLAGTTVIRSEGWNMINLKEDLDLASITHGERCNPYDKSYLFKKKVISEINYTPGCHQCNVVGPLQLSSKMYMLYHYKCLNMEYMIARYKVYGARLSQQNKSAGYGRHYLEMHEQLIRDNFDSWRKNATKLR